MIFCQDKAMSKQMKLDYDLLAREYALHRQVQPDVLTSLIQIAGLTGDSRVLDVGCGTGNYIVALEEATGCLGWGVEPSAQMMANASARSASIQFSSGSAERLDYPADFFDLVFSVDVIHHVQDRAAYFREAHRVLKPGGKVCTVTESADLIRARQPLAVYFPETVEVDLQRYPAISDLRAMMDGAGFRSQQESTSEFPYAMTELQKYQNKAFSCLHLISAEGFARGVQRMQEDIRTGSIPSVWRYLLLWGTK
jgi:ubiquinone/menaquinone biosynthesis C-methylase UbiE